MSSTAQDDLPSPPSDDDTLSESSLTPLAPASAPASAPPSPPPPHAARWPHRLKRAALLLSIVLALWFAYALRPRQPKIVYASRYSREHKFRPAASPVVTETLRDGRVRVRGALPTTSLQPTPKPTPTHAKLTAKRAGKRKSKGSKGRRARKPRF